MCSFHVAVFQVLLSEEMKFSIVLLTALPKDGQPKTDDSMFYMVHMSAVNPLFSDIKCALIQDWISNIGLHIGLLFVTDFE